MTETSNDLDPMNCWAQGEPPVFDSKSAFEVNKNAENSR
jgi:hypothetical protein